ncbi:NepR family anti-sigma factor [Sphingomonas sp. C3-2]|uniref:NepR family anti-sigma factor n=1 Tax=Sphingomonas sp. C3-2 TaxID=3062169 RepID=UPI00294B26BC|nr:NepR family anti-sigma factor [Sphingomonas sp. C3-2]WOK35720.1 NepR family anti-sigma factor [Sphingomonas sp. C3-2]
MQTKLSKLRVQGDPPPVPSTTKKPQGDEKPQRAAAKGATNAAAGGERDLGKALRTVYQKTVDEAIPSEMLDLLSKLG